MSETPPWRAFVPGRLEVFGKHTDYAGGHSLVAAVPRGITVTGTREGGRVIRVVDESTGARATFPLHKEFDEVRSLPGDWRKYPATVIRRLFRNFWIAGVDLSCSISFRSDLPQAAGMSSSSALVIALAEAIVSCSRLDETDVWRTSIRTLEDRASYFGCMENGATFGTLDGDEGVGTHGGSEDHAAILMSRAGHLQQFSFAPLRSERLVKMPEGWTFAIAWSGVHAEKTGAAREAYNRLADPAAMVGPRLQQFVAEDARVLEAADAFERADIAAIGELAADSQRDADVLLGNQVPETRDLVAFALGAGAAAASSFGAGWGGSVWALVPASDAADFKDRWLMSYRAKHRDLASGAFVSFPADGIYPD